MCSCTTTAVTLSNLLWKYLTQIEMSTARWYSLVDDPIHGSVCEAVEYIVLMDHQMAVISFQFFIVVVP